MVGTPTFLVFADAKPVRTGLAAWVLCCCCCIAAQFACLEEFAHNTVQTQPRGAQTYMGTAACRLGPSRVALGMQHNDIAHLCPGAMSQVGETVGEDLTPLATLLDRVSSGPGG